MSSPIESSGVPSGGVSVDHAPATPDTPPPAPPAPAPVYSPGPSRHDILAAVEALPERIGTHLRELMAQRPDPAPTTPATPAATAPAAKAPGRPWRGLADWYHR